MLCVKSTEYRCTGTRTHHSRGWGLSSMNWWASVMPTFFSSARVSLNDCAGEREQRQVCAIESRVIKTDNHETI